HHKSPIANGLLVLAVSLRADARDDVPRRVRMCRQSIRPAARRTWLAAGVTFYAAGSVPRVTEFVFSLAHRHRVPHCGMAGHRARGVDADRMAPAAWIRRVRGGVGTDVAALSLVCERRADVLQLRLGNAAPRERLSGDLPWRLGDRTEH